MTGGCPDEETLFLSLDDELDPQSQLDLLRHLSTCEACRRRIAEMTALARDLSDALAQDETASLLSASEFGGLKKRVVETLKASGSIVPARRLAFGVRVRRLIAATARGAGKVVVLATKAAPTASALANGGTRALKAAEKATKFAYRAAGGRQWRLAW